jgi:hypothetical protein
MAPEKSASPSERARRRRNVALGLMLGFMVVLFFVMTMVRLSGQAGAGLTP